MHLDKLITVLGMSFFSLGKAILVENVTKLCDSWSIFRHFPPCEGRLFPTCHGTKYVESVPDIAPPHLCTRWE